MKSEHVDVLLDDDELFTVLADSIANSDGESKFCEAISNWCQTHKVDWCKEADSKMWYDFCIRLKIPVQYPEVVRVLKTRNRMTDVAKLTLTPSNQPTLNEPLDDMDIDEQHEDTSNDYKFFTYRGKSFRRIFYSHCRDLRTERSLNNMISQYCAALREARLRLGSNSSIANDLRQIVLDNLETLGSIKFNPTDDYIYPDSKQYLKNALRSVCEFDTPQSIPSLVEELLIAMKVSQNGWDLPRGVRNLVAKGFDQLHRDIGRQHAFKVMSYLTRLDLQFDTFKLLTSSTEFIHGWQDSSVYATESAKILSADQLSIVDEGYPLISASDMSYFLSFIELPMNDPRVEMFQARKAKIRVFTQAMNKYLDEFGSDTPQGIRKVQALKKYIHKATVDDAPTYSKFLNPRLYVQTELLSESDWRDAFRQIESYPN